MAIDLRQRGGITDAMYIWEEVRLLENATVSVVMTAARAVVFVVDISRNFMWRLCTLVT